MCPACDPRQFAYAFNQPLSWDTSRVTNVNRMFAVRCAPPAPRAPQSAQSRALPSARCVHTALPAASRAFWPAPTRPALCALLETLGMQEAKAFNQPLSWDTSSVTQMDFMFGVRCSPRPAPTICSRTLSPARCVHRDRAPYTRAGGGSRMAMHCGCFPCAAPPRAPPPNLYSRMPAPLHAASVHTLRDHPPPPASGPHSPPRTVCPACDPRQYAYAFNQSLSWDTSRVTNVQFMFHVRFSPRPVPPQSALTRPVPCTLCGHRDRAPCTRGRRLVPVARASPLLYTPHTLRATRQYATSLSAANKLLIRCAWAGTPAFASAGYGTGGSQGWPSDPCP